MCLGPTDWLGVRDLHLFTKGYRQINWPLSESPVTRCRVHDLRCQLVDLQQASTLYTMAGGMSRSAATIVCHHDRFLLDSLREGIYDRRSCSIHHQPRLRIYQCFLHWKTGGKEDGLRRRCPGPNRDTLCSERPQPLCTGGVQAGHKTAR